MVFALLLLQDSPSELIERLGDPDIRIRNSAYDALLKRLPAVIPDLERHRNHSDLEVALGCRQLLSEHHRAVAAAKELAQQSTRGKVAFIDSKKSTLAIDLRERHGARAGDLLEVTREGRRVGGIVITEVHAWGSWAKPQEGTAFEAIRKGDRVEKIADPKPPR